MLKQIITFLKAYAKGQQADLDLTIELTWWEVGAIVLIIALIIRWIWM